MLGRYGLGQLDLERSKFFRDKGYSASDILRYEAETQTRQSLINKGIEPKNIPPYSSTVQEMDAVYKGTLTIQPKPQKPMSLIVPGIIATVGAVVLWKVMKG